MAATVIARGPEWVPVGYADCLSLKEAILLPGMTLTEGREINLYLPGALKLTFFWSA